jgi:hypothetical protein
MKPLDILLYGHQYPHNIVKRVLYATIIYKIGEVLAELRFPPNNNSECKKE